MLITNVYVWKLSNTNNLYKAFIASDVMITSTNAILYWGPATVNSPARCRCKSPFDFPSFNLFLQQKRQRTLRLESYAISFIIKNYAAKITIRQKLNTRPSPLASQNIDIASKPSFLADRSIGRGYCHRPDVCLSIRLSVCDNREPWPNGAEDRVD